MWTGYPLITDIDYKCRSHVQGDKVFNLRVLIKRSRHREQCGCLHIRIDNRSGAEVACPEAIGPERDDAVVALCQQSHVFTGAHGGGRYTGEGRISAWTSLGQRGNIVSAALGPGCDQCWAKSKYVVPISNS